MSIDGRVQAARAYSSTAWSCPGAREIDPNQINNWCGFPGIFRGLFDVRARRVNDEMKLAAAHALASIVSDSELCDEYITPSMFDSRVVPAVASAVADAAVRTGVARRRRG